MANETEILMQAIEDKFKGLNIPSDQSAEVTALKTQVADLSEKSAKITELENALVKQGTEMAELKLKATHAEEVEVSVGEEVKQAIRENDTAFKSFVNKERPFRFELKDAGTMLISTNITGSTTLLPVPQMIPGYNPYRYNAATFLDFANVGTTNSARIAWVDAVSPDGTVTAQTEGSAKAQIDKDDKVSTSDAVTMAAYLKISTQMLDDIDFMADQVNNELVTRVRLASSDNILTYIIALANKLTAVDASLAGMAGVQAGTAANIWQLIVAAGVTLNKSNHAATHCFLNPTDYARLLLLKGDAETPVVISAGYAMVGGIMVVPSNSITVDKYLCCDYSKLNVLRYKPLSVEMGWENDDFTRNLRTFLGEWRYHRFVKNNDETAFLYGDITDDLTTLAS